MTDTAQPSEALQYETWELVARLICEAKGYDPYMPVSEAKVQWQTFSKLAKSTVADWASIEAARIPATPTEPTASEVKRAPRFHVEGWLTTEGKRWIIWDSVGHFDRFKNIADEGDAIALCKMLNELAARPSLDEVRDIVAAAYWTGAQEAHLVWSEASDEQRVFMARNEHPDFTEASSDHAIAALAKLDRGE